MSIILFGRMCGAAGCVVMLLAGLCLAENRNLDDVTYIGVGIQQNLRSGYYIIDNKRQKKELAANTQFSVTGGKRLPLTSWLRLSTEFSYGFASEAFDTVYDQLIQKAGLDDTVNMSLNHDYTDIGFLVQSDWIFAQDAYVFPYFFIATGFHYFRMKEYGKVLPGSQLAGEPVSLSDAPDKSSLAFQPQIGVGFDIALGKGWGLGVVLYNAYWWPVSYKYEADLILSNVPYFESYRTFGATARFWWR